MSKAPTQSSTAGRLYLALRKKARADGRTTDELLQLAVLEAFVDRLAGSVHARHFVLKGGVLLAAYDARRPTRDVDLAARNVPNDPAALSVIIQDVLAVPRDDGWMFEATTAETIREQDVYSGVRVNVPGSLASANVTFHVDVNIGDVVIPPPVEVTLPRLLGGEIRTRGYPLSMVIAEKVVTAVQRRTINTRWRDFADIFLLSRAHAFTGNELGQSIHHVAAHRGAPLVSLVTALHGYAQQSQNRWAAWVSKQMLRDRLPLDFASVLQQVQAFADPILTHAALHFVWNPASQQWTRAADERS